MLKNKPSKTSLLKSESGQDIVEYTLVIVLIAIVAIVVLSDLGGAITGLLARLTNTLNALAQ
jgi:Flp pilus assembly pilin Flp